MLDFLVTNSEPSKPSQIAAVERASYVLLCRRGEIVHGNGRDRVAIECCVPDEFAVENDVRRIELGEINLATTDQRTEIACEPVELIIQCLNGANDSRNVAQAHIGVALLRKGWPEQIGIADVGSGDYQARAGNASLHIGEVIVGDRELKLGFRIEPSADAGLTAEKPFVATWQLDRSGKIGRIEPGIQVRIEDGKGTGN